MGEPDASTARPPADGEHETSTIRWCDAPPMRYPNSYVWFVFVSTMDVMLTWAILSREGGSEVNPIARAVIDMWGLPGAIAFKFSLMLYVIIACEASGRKHDHVGRNLAYAAVIVSGLAVAYSLALLSYHTFFQPI